MNVLCISEPGAWIAKKGRRLFITKAGQRLAEVPVLKLDQIVLLGPTQLTGPAMHLLLEHGVDVVFLSTSGRYRGRLTSFKGGAVELRRHQFRTAEQPEFQLACAKSIVRGKIQNQRLILRRQQQRVQDSQIAQTLTRLNGLVKKLEPLDSVDSVRGIEGAAAADYFRVFPQLIFGSELEFNGRTRRPPKDEINALLSFGYALLLGEITSAVYTVGLDPHLGYLHEIEANRPSLILDLMEEFRPLVVDSLVLSAVNRKQFCARDFQSGLDGFRLEKSSLKKFLLIFQETLDHRIFYPLRQESCSYRQIFLEQTRLLARAIQSHPQSCHELQLGGGPTHYVSFTPR